MDEESSKEGPNSIQAEIKNEQEDLMMEFFLILIHILNDKLRLKSKTAPNSIDQEKHNYERNSSIEFEILVDNLFPDGPFLCFVF